MGIPRNIIDIAVDQGGCVRRSQLIENGLTDRQVDRLLISGDVTKAPGDSYRVLPSKGWIDDVKAGLCAIPGSVASHQAAAVVHEFPRLRRAEPVITAHTRTTHMVPGVRVIRSHDLSPDHVTTISGMRVTTIPRTVFDLCAVLHGRYVQAIVEDLILEHRVRPGELTQVLDSCARRGKPGVTAFRRILDHVGPGFVAMTELERRGSGLLRRSGITPGDAELPIPWEPQRRFDLAWPSEKVALEWDSRRWHGAMEQMTFDRRRDRNAIRHGWVILRFTWDDITVRPHEVVTEVRAILDERKARP